MLVEMLTVAFLIVQIVSLSHALVQMRALLNPQPPCYIRSVLSPKHSLPLQGLPERSVITQR